MGILARVCIFNFHPQGSVNCKYLQIIPCMNIPSHTNNNQIKYEILYEVKWKIAFEIVGFRILTTWQYSHWVNCTNGNKMISQTFSELEQQRKIWSLQWRHNDHDSVSNHQPHGCLLKRLFRRRSKKTSKLRVTSLCVVNSPGPVNSPHKGRVTRKMFPFDDVIMIIQLRRVFVQAFSQFSSNTFRNCSHHPGETYWGRSRV